MRNNTEHLSHAAQAERTHKVSVNICINIVICVYMDTYIMYVCMCVTPDGV